MTRARLIAACLAMAFAWHAKAADLFATPQTLPTVLQAAKGGDRVILSGQGGDVVLRGVRPASRVQIVSTSIGGPRSLTIRQSANLDFEGVSIAYTPDAATTDLARGLVIEDSASIRFANGRITGGPAVAGGLETDTVRAKSDCVIGRPCGIGIGITRSSRVEIVGNDISQWGRGIGLYYATDTLIQGNRIHDTRRTPINGAGLLRVKVDSNRLSDIRPWRWGETPLGDHGDFIAFWIDANQTFDSEGVEITNNLLDQGQGTAVLGSWLQDGATRTFIRPVYRGNTILNGNFQGITLRGVVGAIVERNILLQASGGPKDAPSILWTGRTVRSVASGNTAAQVADLTKSAGLNANRAEGTVKPPMGLSLTSTINAARAPLTPFNSRPE
jgi:parallel beta-helix repeat protein